MDKGTYTEYTYEDDKHMTEKQKKAFKDTSGSFPNHITMKGLVMSVRKKENVGDQSREYLAQNCIRQNTFDDQLGEFTLPPQLKMHAGDLIEVKLSKVRVKKKVVMMRHSGSYIIKGVAHHFFNDSEGYTRVSTLDPPHNKMTLHHKHNDR